MRHGRLIITPDGTVKEEARQTRNFKYEKLCFHEGTIELSPKIKEVHGMLSRHQFVGILQ